MNGLVSTEWLGSRLGEPNLRILDATLFLPGEPRDARSEFQAEHIPGSVFLDLEQLSDPSSPLPHMLPPEDVFAARIQALGVGEDDRIVVYDNSPLHSAARAWWMLRAFGARRAAILDGGLPKWKAEGRPLESGAGRAAERAFAPSLDAGAVADKGFVSSILGSPGWEIVDARPAGRFTGENKEPRPGMASGHIPGSMNLPQGTLFEPDNSWKRGDALRSAFEAAGVDLSKPMVATCGSGVTAAVLLFGAHLLGKEDVKLYDGSWSEWGADPETPKEAGAA